ncbi:response regulator [Marinobacter adhaerens]|uniref:response regulator n=1 Tax=Marinobacter adhaerens TaxID=1033846 RepID=UPI001E49636F|nr:response regulator transcription factor [Marinobacter adhaerens]MCD1646506.1 response regulator transcription factor [Marinobacter adhaerens]
MPHEKKVALVDDHKLVRAGIKGLVNSLGGYRVVSEGANGLDAIEIVEASPPDILLMDVSMPGVTGIDAVKQIRQHNEKLPVLMLSMYDSPEFVINALRHGADGYILKDSAEHELELALDYVCQKKPFLSPSVARHLIDLAVNTLDKVSPSDQLTERQREVLAGIAEGLSSRQIAEKLGVSVKTIESHRSQMMHRLGLNSSVELVRFALSTHLS